jgi:hypothetical protein
MHLESSSSETLERREETEREGITRERREGITVDKCRSIFCLV